MGKRRRRQWVGTTYERRLKIFIVDRSRYHRTFKDFYADHGPATTIDELQALCDRFRWHYNHQRPHQSLNQQIPAEVHQALPKVVPGDPRPRRRKTGPRVLIASPQGSVHYRKRKIGIGMPSKGQQVTDARTVSVDVTPSPCAPHDPMNGFICPSGPAYPVPDVSPASSVMIPSQAPGL